MSVIYLHIPFCRQACNYCNFHFTTSLLRKDEFVSALTREIQITAPLTAAEDEVGQREQIETVYFGGGTPSLLSPAELSMIMNALRTRFDITTNAEITLEANPDDINAIALGNWQRLGINRLSIGIQSFQEKELQWMNRAHTATESMRCLDLVAASGINNYSIDLIYGSPLLDDDGWKKNVNYVIERNIPHISCYGLTVEPKTPLDKMIRLKTKLPVDPARQANQFELLMQWMEEAGYEHYEISNFAKPGWRSQHNSSYWQGTSYYGFGPAAHSFDGATRRWNIANNAIYIQSIQQNIIPFEAEILTQTQQLNEYIMTSLRTLEGLNLERVKTTFGTDILKKLVSASEKWQNGNKLIEQHNHLALTKAGKLFADGIAADLFF